MGDESTMVPCHRCGTRRVYRSPPRHSDPPPESPATCSECLELIALHSRYQPLGGRQRYAL